MKTSFAEKSKEAVANMIQNGFAAAKNEIKNTSFRFGKKVLSGRALKEALKNSFDLNLDP